MCAEFGGPRGIQRLRANGRIFREEQPCRSQGTFGSGRQACRIPSMASEPEDHDGTGVRGAQHSEQRFAQPRRTPTAASARLERSTRSYRRTRSLADRNRPAGASKPTLVSRPAARPGNKRSSKPGAHPRFPKTTIIPERPTLESRGAQIRDQSSGKERVDQEPLRRKSVGCRGRAAGHTGQRSRLWQDHDRSLSRRGERRSNGLLCRDRSGPVLCQRVAFAYPDRRTELGGDSFGQPLGVRAGL